MKVKMKLRAKTMVRICTSIGLTMIIGFIISFLLVLKSNYDSSNFVLENALNSTSVELDLWSEGQENQIKQAAGQMNRLTDDNDRAVFLKETVGLSADMPNGIYYASEDKRIIYPKFQQKFDTDTSYDPTTRDWYQTFLKSTGIIITDVYIDNATNDLCLSYGMKLADGRSVLGGDVFLNSITSMLENTKIFETGKLLIVDKAGYIIGSNDETLSGKMLNEYSNDIATALSKEHIPSSLRINGVKTSMQVLDNKTTGWKILVAAPESEVFATCYKLGAYFILIALVIIAIMIIMSSIIAGNVVRPVKKAQIFAKALANGDFTVEHLNIKTGDELENLSKNLDDMYQSNKEIISNISEHAKTIEMGSDKLENSVNALSNGFSSVRDYMSQVNNDTMQESAATEQVNASIEEVRASVELMQSKAKESGQLAEMIKNRAETIKGESILANDNAQQLALKFQESLQQSMKNAKVVENIGNLADVISDIAGQVGLLALNASIEAARAGEQGKGFAVVATEIAKLSQKTSNTVSEIQTTVIGVKEAFERLSGEAKNMLHFVTETVEPDYEKFVEVGRRYEEDAKQIDSMSSVVSEMALNLESTMKEVSAAIENITESAQSTADNSSKVMMVINQVGEAINDVTDISQEEKDISDKLAAIIKSYKL